MQISLNLSDEFYPFEKMLDVIRKQKPLATVKVIFHKDDANDLFYQIEGNLVDDNKVIDAILGK